MGLVTRVHREWLAGERDHPLEALPENPDIGFLLGHHLGEPGFYDFPIGVRLYNLGVTPQDLSTWRNQRVLGIGCGEKASFVRWLRELDVGAEGIDPLVENGVPWLMKRKIQGFGVEDGRIPQPDRAYAFVGLHSLPMVGAAFSSIPKYEHLATTDALVDATAVIVEGARVLAEGGRFAIWPALSRTEYLTNILGPGYSLVREHLVDEVPEELAGVADDVADRSVIRRV